ncbi:MAG: hypothetical protein ACE5JI_08230 [Acidobacteriota bacterium]
MLLRPPFLLLAALLLLSPSPPGCGQGRAPSRGSFTRAELAQLILQISEEGGYFWSNNYISNETSYLHVLEPLKRLKVRGGVYVGVGPNQNFTYISHIRPRLAFIIDLRRQNMLEHLIFKVLIEKSETRQEFLSWLTSRPIHGPPLTPDASIEDIVSSVQSAVPDHDFFLKNRREVIEELFSWEELELTASDLQDIERIYREFFRQGLDIKYDSWRSFFFPSLKEFLLETDLEGGRHNWLASAETYRFVRAMHRANLIVPAVGDFAGKHALRTLGAVVETRGETVSAFYLSNVEFYLFRQRKWDRFVENVRRLPFDEGSVLIRAYANLHRPHPEMVGDHITVSLVQKTQNFLDNADRGLYQNLWDVVTLDYTH